MTWNTVQRSPQGDSAGHTWLGTVQLALVGGDCPDALLRKLQDIFLVPGALEALSAKLTSAHESMPSRAALYAHEPVWFDILPGFTGGTIATLAAQRRREWAGEPQPREMLTARALKALALDLEYKPFYRRVVSPRVILPQRIRNLYQGRWKALYLMLRSPKSEQAQYRKPRRPRRVPRADHPWREGGTLRGGEDQAGGHQEAG